MTSTQIPLDLRVDTDSVSVHNSDSVTTSARRHRWMASPILVLVAACAIYGGYERLHFLPEESPFPVELLVVVSLPVAIGLTRHSVGRKTRLLRTVMVLCGASIVPLGVLALMVGGTPWTQLLGVASLAMAVALLLLVAAGERQERSPSLSR